MKSISMTSAFHIHSIAAFVVNALITALIIYFVLITGSDKSPLIFMVFYPLLILLNLIIGLILWRLRSPKAKIYKQTTLALGLLLLPLLFIVSRL